MNTTQFFALLVCNKLIDCCLKLHGDGDGALTWSSDGDDIQAPRIVTLH
jgi:hypothetical protein